MTLVQVTMPDQMSQATVVPAQFSHRMRILVAERFAKGPLEAHIALFLKVFLQRSPDLITRYQVQSELCYLIELGEGGCVGDLRTRIDAALCDFREAWELDVETLQGFSVPDFDSEQYDIERGLIALPTDRLDIVTSYVEAGEPGDESWQPNVTSLCAELIGDDHEINIDAFSHHDDDDEVHAQDADFFSALPHDAPESASDPDEGLKLDCELYDIAIVDDNEWEEALPGEAIVPTIVSHEPLAGIAAHETASDTEEDYSLADEGVDKSIDAAHGEMSQSVQEPASEPNLTLAQDLDAFRQDMRAIAEDLRQPVALEGLQVFQANMDAVLGSLKRQLDGVAQREEHAIWHEAVLAKIEDVGAQNNVRQTLDAIISEQRRQSELLSQLIHRPRTSRGISEADEDRLDHAIQMVLERGISALPAATAP
ncbi:hypothetical protein [Woodsholea maritima]|uniref:hypothetical protein n=1 Tax=Woodsholea maritima TaxID=240237 RepID=UPI000375DE49|nr:hypothetical protein [Woodsholea maritima]